MELQVKIKYYENLAEYLFRKFLYLYARAQKKANTRKHVDQSWQQTIGELWDKVVATLCNLDCIKTKAEVIKDKFYTT
jgi:hypothetical protein